MTLFLIFLIIVVWLILLMRSQMSPQGRSQSRRRAYWPEQNPTTLTPPPDPGLLSNSTQDTLISYTDNMGYSDTSSSTYSADTGVWGGSSDANAGGAEYGGGGDYGSSIDTGGSGDFGGFGGGGDFGGGGSGGGWGDSSS
jgi:hypothetical protein